MAKRRRRTRKLPPRRPPARRAIELTLERVPNAATLFWFKSANEQAEQAVRRLLAAIKPVIWLRDRDRVNQIRRARTAEAVIDRVLLATGLGEEAWHERMREFGPAVLPLIAARLRTARGVYRGADLDLVYEKLIADLRWRGDAGAEVLLDCFDDLNDYGRSLACVVLGLLGVPDSQSAGRIWAFYQRVKHNRRESYVVGALWGLVGLRDERATAALVELLLHQRLFYEMFGFFSLVGDARAVAPLLWAAMQLPGDDRGQPLMALVSVAHRIGREALVAELERVGGPDEAPAAAERIAEETLSRPASQAEEFFALFYRGATDEDLARALGGPHAAG